jgi:tetratricopeptide (TPR) repeat protein
VAYGSILRRRRRELHARAASVIGELWPSREEELLAVLAFHRQGAGELEAAWELHARAAERAERLHAVGEALQHLSSALAIAQELGRTDDESGVAGLRLARARVRARTGDVVGAREDLERVLAAGAAPELSMRAHDELGFVLAGAADYRAALPHLEAALDAAVALGDRAAQVSALSRLSLVHTNRLDYASGLNEGERALALAEALGDEHSIATAMDALKQVALQTGDFGRLEELAGRLAAIHRRTDDLWLLQFAVLEVGYGDVLRGRSERAIARIGEALEINRRIGDRGNEPVHLGLLGRAYRGAGEYGRAIELGRRAFALARELDHPEWIALLGAELAGTLLELGAVEEASAVLEAGAAAGERVGADQHLVRCLALQALAADMLGDRERGAAIAERAASVLGRVRIEPPMAPVMGRDAYAALARVWMDRGMLEEAASLLETIVAACEASGASDGIVEGHLVLAELALRRGDIPEATASAEIALAEAEGTGLPNAWLAHTAIADAERVAGDEAGAADHVRAARAQVAALAQTIDDAEVRAAFEAGAAERLSEAGRPG